MNKDELLAFCQRGEGQQVALKSKASSAGKLAEILVALANADGGRAIIGVDPREPKIDGLKDPEQTLDLALKKDRVKSTISKISELGLIEMTRKRTRESLSRFLGESCSCCEGLGYVKSKTTICYEIFREIERISSDVGGDTILVDAHPEVAELLCDEERTNIESLERKLRKRIVVQGKDKLQQEEFHIVDL